MTGTSALLRRPQATVVGASRITENTINHSFLKHQSVFGGYGMEMLATETTAL